MTTKSKCRRLFALLLMLVMLLTVFLFVGCTKDNSGTQSKGSKKSSDSAKGEGYKKFSKLKIGMTESEVNEVLGKPTRVDKAYYYYNIKVNGQDLELNVWIDKTSDSVTSIFGDFYKDKYRAEFADSKTDLSKVSDLKSGKINTYDACVAAFKTSGYLISIDKGGVKKYLWANTKDGYMTVTFKSNGSVQSYSGVC